LVNKKGNQDIVHERIEIGHKNIEDVYNAIHALTIRSSDPKPKVRLEDIWNYLEEKTVRLNNEIKGTSKAIYESGIGTRADLNEAIKRKTKKTISIRTIQRCIDNDPRIKKEGWYFYIDDKARFEKRYLHPTLEGRLLYKEFRENMSNYYDGLGGNKSSKAIEMRHLVTEIGFFMVYGLIDACRPFRDKSLSLDEREDLVRYWIQNSIPILPMLTDFLEYFKPDYFPSHEQMMADIHEPDKVKAGKRRERERKEKDLSQLEMDEQSIENAFSMLEDEYPTQYKIIGDCTFSGKTMSPFNWKEER
jgi:hypothetical protein